jgi:hypothetical protein
VTGLAVLGGLGAVAAFSTALLDRQAARLGLGRGRGGRLLFACASAALPLVGPLALALLMRRLARPEARPQPRPVQVPLANLADRLSVMTDVPAEGPRGNLEARLRFDPDPANRVAAVLATRRLRPGDAIRLLKLGLRDRHEDVRLLAHALLADRDQRAFRAIDELEHELAIASADRRGRLASLLAEALSDLCTTGLVSGELESATRRRAQALLDGRPS